ncbi:hypothetical protein [Clostridium pasteurianum]|nr:hypothetical protein F502_01795 [Clostridium pasteurianum DSM 525 = ATCC 6013]
MASGRNSFQNYLTFSNIQLENVVSGTFGKIFHKIIDKILQNHIDISFNIKSLIYGSMKKKLSELELAVQSYITPEQAGKLKIIKAFGNTKSRVRKAYSCSSCNLSPKT